MGSRRHESTALDPGGLVPRPDRLNTIRCNFTPTRALPPRGGGHGWGWAPDWWSIYGTWYAAFGAAEAGAAESVLLRASLAQPRPVLVGERVPIMAELLTATTFASAPVFELPTMPGALMMQIEDRPVLGTEDIGGEGYTVQRHELALFAMRPSLIQVPSFTVRFESPAHFGEQPIEYRLTTPALQVEARMPPGAENLPGLIATRAAEPHEFGSS
jgi:hypothetical protein